jgi:hypothetical protein
MPKILVLGQEGACKCGFSGQESGTLIIFGGYAEEKFSRDETVVIAFANTIDDQFLRVDSVLLGFPIFQEDTRQMIEDEKTAETSMPADNPPRAEAVIIRNP